MAIRCRVSGRVRRALFLRVPQYSLRKPPEVAAKIASFDILAPSPSKSVSAKVTEGLLSYNFDLEPKPQLATNWSVSDDGRELTFELRKGVRWHDGA